MISGNSREEKHFRAQEHSVLLPFWSQATNTLKNVTRKQQILTFPFWSEGNVLTGQLTGGGGASMTSHLGSLATIILTEFPQFLSTWATCSLVIPCTLVPPICKMWSPVRSLPSCKHKLNCSKCFQSTHKVPVLSQNWNYVGASSWPSEPMGENARKMTTMATW